MSDALVCRTPSRRVEVVRQGLNGLDGIDVLEGQTTLRVHLLANAPRDVTSANVRIEGGRSITNIRVQSVQPTRGTDDADPCLLVTVDRPGDFSTYVLHVVDLPGFDPRFAALPFSFKVDCRVDTDCAAEETCQPPDYPQPELSYLVKDYESLRALLLERMSVVLPDWNERHVPDLQLSLVELLAYAGDELSMFQDSVGTEAYLETARRRISVRRHARLVDYVVHAGCNARAWMCVEVSGELTVPAADVAFLAAAETIGTAAVVVPCEVLDDLPDGAAAIFEPIDRRDLRFREELNGIELWAWGDDECCLEIGATSATLRGQPDLHPGHVLILEEVKGPRTGAPADADPTHRQAVRLTEVTTGTDPLYEQPIVTVSWGPDDALRFALCLSAAVGEDCHIVDDLAVARGNVVFVDHGATVGWCAGEDEPLAEPVADPRDPLCAGPCEPVSVAPVARRYEPRLARRPVTQCAPFPPPEVRAARQWQLLATLPDRARAVIDRVLRAVQDGAAPDPDDLAILEGLLGPAVLANAGLPDDSDVEALQTLSARFGHLMAPVEARLRMILRRLLAGRPLTALVVEELVERWGTLVDADALTGPETIGPATTARDQDPRAALPALVLTSVPPDTGVPVTWTTRPDLLESEPDDDAVVGELDDDGTLVLRFGAATGLGRPRSRARRYARATASATARPATSRRRPSRGWCCAERTPRRSDGCATRCPPLGGSTRRRWWTPRCSRQARHAETSTGRRPPTITRPLPRTCRAYRPRRLGCGGPAAGTRRAWGSTPPA